MQIKYWIIPGSMVAILVASLLALSSPNTSKESSPKPTCCKKVVKDCQIKTEENFPPQNSLETLSTQFIAVPLN